METSYWNWINEKAIPSPLYFDFQYSIYFILFIYFLYIYYVYIYILYIFYL